MTSSFLDNLSLQTLIAPVPAEEFRAHYWEQKPLIVQRGNQGYYGDLFTLDDFDAAIARNPEYVKLANAESKKNASYKPVVQGLEAVLSDMREGGTLVLDQLHKSDPKLGLLCRALAPELGHRFQTNLYLTPPHGKGFTPHWDNHDVFILQVLGSKHWKIEKTRRALPEPAKYMDDEGRELRGEPTSFTLRQGDLIYIPRGWVHAAECGEEPSLHITYGVTAFFFDELFSAVIKAARLRDESLAMALPLGFMRGSGAELVRRLKAALHEMSDEKFLSDVVDQYRDELVRSFPLDISGQVRDFFRPQPVTLDDIVGPRRGSVYRIHMDGDSVRLNFGARSITFLGLFRQALEFALNTQAYAVREVIGDLADEERIAFIERLIEEGLVIRKTNGSA
jgi:ribosomal protein L16 Arg81 hydroxylase